MTILSLWFTRLLLFAVGLCGIYSIVMMFVRKRNVGVFWTRKEKIIAFANNHGSKIAMLILGMVMGYGIRDHQLTSNTRTYSGVAVLSQQSDRQYTVQIPGYARAYDFEFCHPLKMPGPLIDIKYEQRFGCNK